MSDGKIKQEFDDGMIIEEYFDEIVIRQKNSLGFIFQGSPKQAEEFSQRIQNFLHTINDRE